MKSYPPPTHPSAYHSTHKRIHVRLLTVSGDFDNAAADTVIFEATVKLILALSDILELDLILKLCDTCRY